MDNTYFHINNIANEQEIEVVDAFLRQVETVYIGNERKGQPTPIENIGQKTSSHKTEFFTIVGIISGFLLLLIIWGDANFFVTIFAILGLLGNGYSFMQLKRSENYVQSTNQVHREVHEYKQRLQKEKELEDRLIKIRG
jgi:hypothetical protein